MLIPSAFADQRPCAVRSFVNYGASIFARGLSISKAAGCIYRLAPLFPEVLRSVIDCVVHEGQHVEVPVLHRADRLMVST